MEGSFHGAAVITLDAKGRIAVPTRHRGALLDGGNTVVLTAHPEGCVLIYPESGWEPLVSSTCVESGGEVILLDPLAPRDDAADVWERLDARPPTVVVIFDQFEEAFTIGAGRPETAAFFRDLADLVENYTPLSVRDRLAASGAGSA